MVRTSHKRVLCLSRSTDQLTPDQVIPVPHCPDVEKYPTTAQPERPHHVGKSGSTRGSMVTPPTHPSSLAGGPLPRQIPKVGAECANRACSDLFRVRRVTGG